ncbi:MAG: hypothetical protein JNJ46_26345 [Myxococcales bacterium]|nr:hypothetical protein [Myxococcales bacterium]
MPRFFRVSNTFDELTAMTSQQYSDCVKGVYEGLSSGAKSALSNQLSIGSAMPKNDKGARRRERVRRLLAALVTEDRFGTFGCAMMKLAAEHKKVRDHWELERVMTHTYVGMGAELNPSRFNGITRQHYETWVSARDMYANSCGGFAAMLRDLLPDGRDANKWVQVVDNVQLTKIAAKGHLDALSQVGWKYCYVRLGCHAWVFERITGTNNARNVQVWSNMNVDEMGFNYAYSLDRGWGLTVHTIGEYKTAMRNLIDEVNEDAALRTLIADPRVLWGIDPNAGGANAGRVNLRLETLALGDVDNDIKANLAWQANQNINDYSQSGLNLPDIR